MKQVSLTREHFFSDNLGEISWHFRMGKEKALLVWLVEDSLGDIKEQR